MTENNNKPFSTFEEGVVYLAKGQRNSENYNVEDYIEDELSDEELAFSKGYEQACNDFMRVLMDKVTLGPELLEAMKQHLNCAPDVKSAA
jgi:hypothetical protein